MPKSLTKNKNGDENNDNQFLTLISDTKKEVDAIIDNTVLGKELEFIFYSGTSEYLNKERYIYLLKYIKIISDTNKNYTYDPPHNMLDVSFSLSETESIRITVSDVDGQQNIKQLFNTLKKRSSNFSIFKMLLYLAKKSKDKTKFGIMKKVRNKENIYDIKEFDVRCKLADEIDLYDKVIKNSSSLDEILKRFLNNDDFELEDIKDINSKILFRHKSRTSLYFAKTTKNFIRMDLTSVKSSKSLRFINKQIPQYELELEIETAKASSELKANIYFTLEKIMQLIQQSNYIVSNPIKEGILTRYKELILGDINARATSLEGRQPVSLEMQHVTEKLPNQYAVTDKADGDRAFLITHNDQVYIMFTNLRIIDTGIVLKSSTGKIYNDSVLDGEYIWSHKYRRHVYMTFDCLYSKGVDIRRTDSLMDRLHHADEIIDKCFVTKAETGFEHKSAPKMKTFNLDELAKFYKREIKSFYKNLVNDLSIKSPYPVIRRKYFVPCLGAKKWEIFKYSSIFWSSYKKDDTVPFPYHLDGLIYQPLQQAYVTKSAKSKLTDYKWKPADQNSVDFYVEFKKNSLTKTSMPVFDNTNEINGKLYKICNLFVGRMVNGKEKPTLFNKNNGYSEVYLFLENGEARDENGDIISDRTVVEFYYNNDLDIDPRYRWVPIRTRHDKTDFVDRFGKKYGNYIDVADKVWNSIINPVTMADFDEFAKGENAYFKKEDQFNKRIDSSAVISANTNDDSYYQNIKKNSVDMRQNHNWDKDILIFPRCYHMYGFKDKKSVLDFACGKGGDSMKFYFSEVSHYVGIDLFRNNLNSPINGAKSRYNKMKRQYPNFPRMTHIQGDLRALLTDTDQEKALNSMGGDNRQLLAKHFPKNGKKSMFDIINCQFAIHYFLETDLSWSNFKQNVKNHLRTGGFFLVTTMAGSKVRAVLKGKDNYSEFHTDKSGEKRVLFDIVKKFDDNAKQGTGNKIDFFASWIFEDGNYLSEYIVDEEFLIEELARDCDLVLDDHGYFDNTLDIHKDYFENYVQYQSNKDSKKFFEKVGKYYEDKDINVTCREFTKLNCFYVFRKVDKKSSMSGGSKKSPLKDIADQPFNFFDEKTFEVHDMKGTDKSYSFMNSIHDILVESKIVPHSLNMRNICKDLGIKQSNDNNLDLKYVKNLCKNMIICNEEEESLNNNKNIDSDSEFEMGEAGRNTVIKTVLDGLNIVTVQRDCNNHYDIEYVRKNSKNSKGKYAVLIKDGNYFRPLYQKNETSNSSTGLFDRSNDVVSYLLDNGENVTP